VHLQHQIIKNIGNEMKKLRKYLISLVLASLSLSSLTAAVTWDPYLAFSRGNATIEEEKLSCYELAVGSFLGLRGAIELFLLAQPISVNCLNSSDAHDSGVVGTCVFMTGIKTSITLFKDAFVNPMIQAGFGQMMITSFESPSQQPEFFWNFYGSIATGFEIDFGDSFKIYLLCGIRFTQHDQVMHIEKNGLSSKYSSIGFRVQLS